MPESFWTDRAIEEIDKFQAHNIVRKHLSPELMRALSAERERLTDICIAQLQAEQQAS